MNFYALNAVPLNGWDTIRGQGFAELSIAATGNGSFARFGSGTSAMSMLSAGSGTARRNGSGAALLALQTEGSGIRRVLGSAAPVLQMLAQADGETLPSMGGIMAMVMRGSADARVTTPLRGNGHMGMLIDSHGRLYAKTPVRGSGQMDTWLNPGAEGRLIYTENSGQMSLSIGMTGRGRSSVRHPGRGSMLLELILLRQQSRQYRLVHGSAYAGMSMTIDTRTARVTTLPGSYVEAPKQRTMQVDADHRAMRVPAASRTEQVMEA